MPGFDFDMAFTIAEVAIGVERLLDKLGHPWSRIDAEGGTAFRITLPSGRDADLTIGPLPAARLTYASFFPRTLLTVTSKEAGEKEMRALRQEVIFAFLRVTG
jgi:hypothetical protein